MDQYNVLTRSSTSSDRDPLIIEIVSETPQPVEAIQARVESALPDANTLTEAVFDADSDRYFFIEFPDIDPKGQESEIFVFARALRSSLDMAEANPVLPDSLYGAAHVGTESFFNFCETPRDTSLPYGWHHARIKTPLAWQHTRGQGSKVAVIDTGYSDHVELRDVIETNGMW